MIGAFIKAYMPRSLYVRAALILLVPVLTILAVVSVVFIQRLYEDVTAQMTRGVADEIALVIARMDAESTPDAALAAAGDVAEALGIGISLETPTVGARRDWFDLSGISVRKTLEEKLPAMIAVDLVETSGGEITVAHNTRHGIVALSVDRDRLSPRNPHQFLVLIGLTAALMTFIALLYLRGQVRPIRRLAAAASAFGKGRVVPYRPLGASEVREAGQAFLEMRDRIERQIEQRTLMLSGVSHDLRTPMTRMRLALSLSDETEETLAILQDLGEMERMLDAFLSFARSEAFDEPESRSVNTTMRDAITRAERADQPVELVLLPEDSSIKVRPVALARALDNLIGNATRYGNNARLSAEISETRVRFVVEDDGPGIPQNKREEAIKAFSRLDEARNQDHGSGVGLGLAISVDIAIQHGGTLLLGKSVSMGGLKAEIVLPR